MPAAWVGAAASAVGAISSASSGGGGGGGNPAYAPQNVTQVDSQWNQAFQANQGIAGDVSAYANPSYLQSLNDLNAINYGGYQSAANQAGQQYGALANTAGGQMGQYGAAAGLASQQQQSLYGAGNQIYQTAFDPQSALYNQQQQNLTNQVNAGQAARGLGNSPVGASEYNDAMGKFDIGWNAQQLQNQATGIQGMSQANSAGGAQGQLMGADLAAQLSAGNSQAGYQQQAGQVPIQAQQYIAQQPSAAASTYGQGMANSAALYGNIQNSSLPYMNAGIGATQWNTGFNSQQNAQNTQALMSSLSPNAGNPSNNPNSWLSNIFGSTNNQNAATQYNQSTLGSFGQSSSYSTPDMSWGGGT